MKKQNCIILVLCVILLITGCQAANVTSNSDVQISASTIDTLPTTIPTAPTTQVKELMFLPMLFDDFLMPFTTSELMEFANEVFIGKVVDISFFAKEIPLGVHIFTTYSIEITHSYIGEKTGIVEFTYLGGIPEKYLDEQAALVEEYKLNGVHTIEGFSYPELGKEFLFVFKDTEDGLSPKAYDQYVYEIDESEIVTDPTVASYKSIMQYLESMAGNAENQT